MAIYHSILNNIELVEKDSFIDKFYKETKDLSP